MFCSMHIQNLEVTQMQVTEKTEQMNRNSRTQAFIDGENTVEKKI